MFLRVRQYLVVITIILLECERYDKATHNFILKRVLRGDKSLRVVFTEQTFFRQFVVVENEVLYSVFTLNILNL